jgi:hypothetical protein
VICLPDLANLPTYRRKHNPPSEFIASCVVPKRYPVAPLFRSPSVQPHPRFNLTPAQVSINSPSHLLRFPDSGKEEKDLAATLTEDVIQDIEDRVKGRRS